MNIQQQIEYMITKQDEPGFFDNTKSVMSIDFDLMQNIPACNDVKDKYQVGDRVKVISNRSVLKQGCTGVISFISTDCNGFINYLVNGVYVRQQEIERINP